MVISGSYSGIGHDRTNKTWSVSGSGRITSQGPYGARRQAIEVTFDDDDINELIRFIADERERA